MQFPPRLAAAGSSVAEFQDWSSNRASSAHLGSRLGGRASASQGFSRGEVSLKSLKMYKCRRSNGAASQAAAIGGLHPPPHGWMITGNGMPKVDSWSPPPRAEDAPSTKGSSTAEQHPAVSCATADAQLCSPPLQVLSALQVSAEPPSAVSAVPPTRANTRPNDTCDSTLHISGQKSSTTGMPALLLAPRSGMLFSPPLSTALTSRPSAHETSQTGRPRISSAANRHSADLRPATATAQSYHTGAPWRCNRADPPPLVAMNQLPAHRLAHRGIGIAMVEGRAKVVAPPQARWRPHSSHQASQSQMYPRQGHSAHHASHLRHGSPVRSCGGASKVAARVGAQSAQSVWRQRSKPQLASSASRVIQTSDAPRDPPYNEPSCAVQNGVAIGETGQRHARHTAELEWESGVKSDAMDSSSADRRLAHGTSCGAVKKRSMGPIGDAWWLQLSLQHERMYFPEPLRTNKAARAQLCATCCSSQASCGR